MLINSQPASPREERVEEKERRARARARTRTRFYGDAREAVGGVAIGTVGVATTFYTARLHFPCERKKKKAPRERARGLKPVSHRPHQRSLSGSQSFCNQPNHRLALARSSKFTRHATATTTNGSDAAGNGNARGGQKRSAGQPPRHVAIGRSR